MISMYLRLPGSMACISMEIHNVQAATGQGTVLSVFFAHGSHLGAESHPLQRLAHARSYIEIRTSAKSSIFFVY